MTKSSRKLCPFNPYNFKLGIDMVCECLGENCALYVKLVKPDSNPVNEIGVLTYEGCGLVLHIPWRMKAEKKEGSAPA